MARAKDGPLNEPIGLRSAATSGQAIGPGSTRVAAGVEPVEMRTGERTVLRADFYHDGTYWDVDTFLAANDVTGVLVLENERVEMEWYREGDGRKTLRDGLSLTKFVTGLLVGIAVGEGLIRDVRDPVERYLRRIVGTAYEGVTVANLLEMTSGVDWKETYTTGEGHAQKLTEVLWRGSAEDTLAFLGSLDRIAQPGSRHNYNSGDVSLMGLVLRAVCGCSLAEYLERKIWSPCGMESDAAWRCCADGSLELPGTGLCATLRDWGRVGQIVVADGRAPDGAQVVPKRWIRDTLSPKATNNSFGYLCWLSYGCGQLYGMRGQYLHMDRGRRIVIVIQSHWTKMSDQDKHRRRAAFVSAVERSLLD